MTDKDIRWGILATGGIAQTLAGDMFLAGVTISAVASRSLDSAQAFAERYGIPTAHGDYPSLAADPDVDAVYIATPHPMHAEWALAMIDAGKHVLVEKSFTVERAEAEQIRDRARAKGVLVMEAMWTRYLPHMARIHEIIAAGTLGELRGLIADHSQKLPSDPAHRINARELGGGALLDLTIYPISFAFDLFGTPETVKAQAVMGPTGVDVVDAISFGYGNGALASLYATSQAAGPNTAVVREGRQASLIRGRAGAPCIATRPPSRALRAAFAAGRNCSQAGVGVAPRRWRRNRDWPSSCSSTAIRWLTMGCDQPRMAATLLKLPRLATSSSNCKSSSVTAITKSNMKYSQLSATTISGAPPE